MTVRKYDHEGNLIEGEGVETQPQAAEDESLESLLQRTERELKSHYPMMVDSATRLDSVTSDTARLRYHYSLLNAAANELDVDATKAALTPVVHQQTQSMSFLKLLLDKGATISFHYNDKDGKEITVIDVKGEPRT
jgi:hypothetical protein